MYREQEEVKERGHKDPRNLPSPLEPRELLVSGILEGEPVKALGEAQMTFKMGGKVFSHKCYVFQDEIINFPGDCDVLVGSSLMHQYKLLLDFDKWRICQGSKLLQRGIINQEGNKPVRSPRVARSHPVNEILEDQNKESKEDSVEDQIDSHEYAVVSLETITVPPGKAAVLTGCLKRKGGKMEDGTPIMVRGNPLQEDCVIIPVICKAEDQVKVLACNWGRVPVLIHQKRRIAQALYMDDREMEPFGNLSKGHNEKQKVLAKLAVNAVVTEIPDNGDEDDPLEQALQIDPQQVKVDQDPVLTEDRFQKLLEELRADNWTLSTSQRKDAEGVLRDFQAAFNLKEEPLGKTNLITHRIETVDEGKVYIPPRFIPYAVRPAVEAEVQALMDQGHVRVSSSEWNAPIVLVKRKDNSHPRLCVDYRALNAKTRPEFYPLPLIEDILYQVSQSKWFSTLDLRSGYHQVPLDKDSKEKSAFSTHLGHYEYNVMPFGLSNAPRTFQRLMNRVFSGQVGKGLQLFLDDIAIYSDDIEAHLSILAEALQRLIQAGLKASPEKSHLFQKEVNLLGHRVGQGNVKPALDKLAAVRNFPKPRNRKEVRRFLGLSGYYRRFVDGYAKKANALTKLTSEKNPFVWGDEQENAFNVLRENLVTEPVLKAPDFRKTWYLSTDASQGAIGAVLAQRYEGHFCPVAYYSRQLKAAESRYTTMEKEALAIIEALKKFKPLVWGLEVVVLSDNRSLHWLFHKAKDGNARVTRWALTAQSFGAKIMYHPGRLNAAADALSRIKVPDGIEAEEVERTSQMIINEAEDCQIVCILAVEPSGEMPEEEQDEEEDGPPWSLEEMIREQREDPLYGPVIRYLKDVTEINRKKVDPNLEVKDFFMDQKLLYKQIQHRNSMRKVEEVLCVPRSLVSKALALVHLAPLGGHGAEERTKFRAKRLFTWRGMDKDISRYCQQCLTCQRFKGRGHPLTPLRRYPVPEEPFQTLAMDLMGPFPLTEAGNKYILVITDFLTRFAVVEALPDKTAEAVAKSIYGIFLQYGVPKTVLTDQGREFRNKFLRCMAKTLGFDHHQIVAYHPASNGLCERTNQQVLSILRGLVDGKEHYWDQYLAEAQLALNAAYHSAIGDTPYYVMFGRDAKTPAEWWTRPTTSYRLPNEDFVATRTQRSQEVYEYVRDNLLRAADRQCKTRMKKSKDTSLREGTRVFVKAIRKKGDSKLSPKWEGPYRVVKEVKPYVYQLRDLQTRGFREVHLENMKVALEATIPRALAPGARKPYPGMGPGEESIIPEGTQEEEEDREMEYLVDCPKPVGVGSELAHATEAQTSREEDEGPDVSGERDSNNEPFSRVASDLCNIRMDNPNNTDSHNASASNAEGESKMNEGMNETPGRNVSPEHAGREPTHERRTSGRTRYGPGYYARLHEGP